LRMVHLLTASMLALGQGSYLADIGPAPPVRLTDSERRPFSLDELRGKVVLVSFVYTTCNGSCPATTSGLDRARRALRNEGLWGRSVEFVSITLDPTRDTPEALAAYAKIYRAEPKSWHFLTGTPERVAEVIASWDMWAKVGPSGVIDHPSRIFLLDPKGHRREIYNLESLTPDMVVRDVRSLLDEEAGKR
jgi:protein SCO1/2